MFHVKQNVDRALINLIIRVKTLILVCIILSIMCGKPGYAM